MKYIGKVLMMLLIILGVSGCQSSRAYEAKQPPMPNQLAEAVNEDTEGELEIYFLDTGNSDCIFINAKQKVLIDAGDNDDESMSVDFLKALKVEKSIIW